MVVHQVARFTINSTAIWLLNSGYAAAMNDLLVGTVAFSTCIIAMAVDGYE